MGRTHSSRHAILDAAESVVGTHGAAHVTLEAVAKHAGVSKGGLLYHFPSKEALLQGMMTRLFDQFAAEQAAIHSTLRPDRPGADLKAFVLASLRKASQSCRVSAALLAAGANDPSLLEPVRAIRRRRFQQFAGLRSRPMRAWVIVLAMEGLWLNDVLGTSVLNRRQRRLLERELLHLTEEIA
jgi:AcrR family transcriptional regulator